MKEEFMGNFKLIHGCISLDERITSRDISHPEFFKTSSEAVESLREHGNFYATIGYKVWFSRIEKWNEEEKIYKIVKN